MTINMQESAINWVLSLNNNGQTHTTKPTRIWTHFRVDSGGLFNFVRMLSAIPITIKIPRKMTPNRVQSFMVGNKSIVEVIKNPPLYAEGFYVLVKTVYLFDWIAGSVQ